MTADKDRLRELIEAARAKVHPVTAVHQLTEALATVRASVPSAFEWNTEQQAGIDSARTGKSFNLIGAAGTGKTTTLKEITRLLVAESIVAPLEISTKYLQQGLPGICITSFTRRAVRASRRVVSEDIKAHCITMHKLLEYEPVFYEVFDETTQKNRVTMRFEPGRNRSKKLPRSLKTIIIDESPMVSTLLFKQLLDALPDPAKVQFIFVGDLHQLPPVYGQAILGFKLLELPTIELKHIYRQAKDSPIISLAHEMKDGKPIPVTQKSIVETSQGKVTIHPWKKPLSDFDSAHAASAFLRELVISGNYDEEEDIILCPQEKVKNTAFGTNEFNRVIAQTLGDKRNALVYEVVAGFNRHYYAVGDRVLAGREDGVITEINKNARYWGKRPRPPSVMLDRWGNYKQKPTENLDDSGDDFDVDKYLESFVLEGGEAEEDRKQEASHVITVELLDSGIKEGLSTAGEINALQFAYAITVHKAQGSEWQRVFFFTHQSHVIMWSRELLYTAITRARRELYMIVEPDRKRPGTLTKAAASPRIKGNTLAEKAEYFKGKEEEYKKQMAAGNNLPQGEEVAGNYRGQKDTPPPQVVTVAPPVKLVRLGDFISAAFRAEAQTRLLQRWKRAQEIWGLDRIGLTPHITFNLQRSKVVGLAALQTHEIKLNALWCLVAEDDSKVKDEMLGDTLDHEICHLVAWNYSKDRGHDSGWRMAMKLMGRAPNVYADETALPSWTASYKWLMEKKMAELRNKSADLADDLPDSYNKFDEV